MLFESKEDLLSVLKAEHDELKELLHEAEDATKATRLKLLEEIEQNLVPHARGEEKTLYAILRERVKDDEDAKDLLNEAYEEHRAVDKLLADLKKTDVDNERWLVQLTVIKENLEHHIKEEENDLFGHARALLSKDERLNLLDAYLEAKESFEDTLPTQGQISERTPSKEAKEAAKGV